MSKKKKKYSRSEKAAKEIKEEKAKRKTLFIYTKGGTLNLKSVQNIISIIIQDKNFNGLFQYNKFTQEVDVMKDWKRTYKKRNTTIYIQKGTLNDDTVNAVELYMENLEQYGNPIFNPSLVDTAIVTVAKMNSYNPVKDYLDKCFKERDNKPHLNTIFSTYLGAKDNETTHLITRLWFLGAVAKVYEPNTKFDYVLDLVGGQGLGKTTLLQKIAPLGLYTDQFNTFTNKDDFEVMRNALIVNDDEMTASNKASFEDIKKFITMQKFEYIKRYGRRPVQFKKKFVIARTTNEKDHLKDRSGDRRFLSIECNEARQKKHPVRELTQNEINQVWGEAVVLYKNMKKDNQDLFLLSEHEEQILKENREEFRYTTGLEDELNDTLENKFKDADFISNQDLSFEMFGDNDSLSRNNKEARQIRKYMGFLGYKVGYPKKINGQMIRGFKKQN